MKKLSLLILIVCSASQFTFAEEIEQASQTNSNRGTRQVENSGPPQTGPPGMAQPEVMAPQVTGESVSAGTTSQRRSTSGRRLSPLKPLRTQSGSMPAFMQRAAARNSGTVSASRFGGSAADRTTANGSTTGRSTTGRSTTVRSAAGTQQSLQQTFLNNAMLFDENSDRQLAANELKNLFILLVSENIQNTQNNYYGFGNGFGNRFVGGVQYGQSGSSRGRSTGNQNFVNQSRAAQLPTIGFLVSDAIPSIQSSSMQDAILLFLLLTLQFDVDGDGSLDRAEIQRFATALLNNELNLNQAAVQSQQRR